MEDNRISLTDMFIKLILVVAFVFLLMWIMPIKNYDHLNPLLDQIFAENIDKMRIAGKAYYTVERMPSELNEKKEISLRTMVDTNMVLPLIDKDGNECDLDASYVSVVKISNEYVMTVNLKCGDQEDFIIEYLGCYDLCTQNQCETDDMVAYLYKRTIEVTKSNTTCPIGYVLSNGSCYKTTNTGGYKDAILVSLPDIKESVAAEKVYLDGEVIYKDSTDRFTTTYADKIANTTTSGGSYSCEQWVDKTCTKTVNDTCSRYVPAVTKTETVPVYGSEKQCTIEYQKPCSSCAAVPVEVCTTVSVVTGYETKTVVVSEGYYESYDCSYTESYDCGYYESTTCNKPTTSTTTYSCPAGYTDNGSNCKKVVFSKSDCNDVAGSTPVGNAYIQGDLKCAINTGSVFSHYDCSNFGSDATLVDKVNGLCEITKPGGTTYECTDGSNPVNGKCYYGTVSTESTKPTVNTWTESNTEYKWSTDPNLEGWIKVKKSEYNV